MYEVKAKNKASFDVLAKLRDERSDIYDFWTEPRSLDDSFDIMVPPAYATTFIKLMQTFDIDYHIKIADVER